jgi:hypothetical protein
MWQTTKAESKPFAASYKDRDLLKWLDEDIAMAGPLADYEDGIGSDGTELMILHLPRCASPL